MRHCAKIADEWAGRHCTNPHASILHFTFYISSSGGVVGVGCTPFVPRATHAGYLVARSPPAMPGAKVVAHATHAGRGRNYSQFFTFYFLPFAYACLSRHHKHLLPYSRACCDLADVGARRKCAGFDRPVAGVVCGGGRVCSA